MVINKFVIIEITESQFSDNTEVNFSIDYNCEVYIVLCHLI